MILLFMRVHMRPYGRIKFERGEKKPKRPLNYYKTLAIIFNEARKTADHEIWNVRQK